MSMHDWVLYDSWDHVATITLNRPEILNAFVPDMIMDVISPPRGGAARLGCLGS